VESQAGACPKDSFGGTQKKLLLFHNDPTPALPKGEGEESQLNNLL
jgi:hypothetical protein